MMARGTLFIVSAPSGGGKTSLVAALIERTSKIVVSVSHTTRLPRAGEVDGKNYYFVTEQAFLRSQAEGIFLEHAQVFNHLYGTSKTWVLEQLNAGIDVILEIDWQGAQKVKAQLPCVSIFILPPSRATLLQRLQGRSQDSAQVIAERMAKASDEISHSTEYDYLVINDQFESALNDILMIVNAQRLRTGRQQVDHADLLKALSSEVI